MSQALPLQWRTLSAGARFLAVRAGLRLAGLVAPRLGAAWLGRLWFTPRRHPQPAREYGWAADARSQWLNLNNNTIAAYVWGYGPPVLLAHGWEGRGTQLGAFVAPLVRAGFSVVAFDAPAHGRSSGARTHLVDIAGAIRALDARVGPFHAVIAHSFGTPCVLHALANARAPRAMVSVSAPATLDGLLARFARRLGVNARVLALFRARIEARFGAHAWSLFSVVEQARALPVPALVIHDRTDDDVPVGEAEDIARAWGAELLLTSGLGHRRILRDPAVVARAVAFIANAGAGV